MHEHGCYGPSFDTDLHEMVAFVEKDHEKLYNRDKEDQHPIEAIEGLEEALENMGGLAQKQKMALPLSTARISH